MLKRPRYLPQKFNQSGQNVVEYALLTVAVLVVVIAFIGKGQFFRGTIENIINDIPDSINRLNDEIVYGNVLGNSIP